MTLIELMIVVAIIAILSAIAIPNFAKFQARSKQSEAKSNLKGIFTAKLASSVEKSTFACGLCGFAPERGNRYTYRAGGAEKVNSYAGTSDETAIAEANVNPSGEEDRSFTATAMGNIDTDGFADGWSIDTSNTLCNGKAAAYACDGGANDINY